MLIPYWKFCSAFKNIKSSNKTGYFQRGNKRDSYELVPQDNLRKRLSNSHHYQDINTLQKYRKNIEYKEMPLQPVGIYLEYIVNFNHSFSNPKILNNALTKDLSRKTIYTYIKFVIITK